MKIMITGATGFIGSNLINRFNKSEHQIHVLCRNYNESISSKPNIKIFSGDITEINSIKKCMGGCDQVYHLAAYARCWVKDKNLFFEANTRAVENILDSAIKLRVKRVLFVSTALTFGPSNLQSNDESTSRLIPPLTVYEESKIEAERIVAKYLDKGLDVITVHPTRPFGPGIINEANALVKMIDLYLKGKFRFILGDGKATGNYVFVDDVAEGCIKAINKGRPGEKYILGGENHSYNELFEIISELSGIKHYLLHIPEKVGLAFGFFEEFLAKTTNHQPFITSDWIRTFSKDWSFSSEKAIKEIDYKITPFNLAIKKTIEWLGTNNKRRTHNENFNPA
jgi:nucleoside-diphosphate-sugar epimerase